MSQCIAIMANPRKFSEKIALHTHRQAEETARFEQIMKEVSDATSRVRTGFRGSGLGPNCDVNNAEPEPFVVHGNAINAAALLGHGPAELSLQQSIIAPIRASRFFGSGSGSRCRPAVATNA